MVLLTRFQFFTFIGRLFSNFHSVLFVCPYYFLIESVIGHLVKISPLQERKTNINKLETLSMNLSSTLNFDVRKVLYRRIL